MCRDRDMNPWNKDSLFIVKSVYLYIYTQKIYIEKQNQFLLERNKVISHSEEISSFTKKKKIDVLQLVYYCTENPPISVSVDGPSNNRGTYLFSSYFCLVKLISFISFFRKTKLLPNQNKRPTIMVHQMGIVTLSQSASKVLNSYDYYIISKMILILLFILL